MKKIILGSVLAALLASCGGATPVCADEQESAKAAVDKAVTDFGATTAGPTEKANAKKACDEAVAKVKNDCLVHDATDKTKAKTPEEKIVYKTLKDKCDALK